MHHYSNDPRVITCKFDSVCSETGKKIRKGEQAVYYPSDKKVYCMESKTAYEFRCWLADCTNGYEY